MQRLCNLNVGSICSCCCFCKWFRRHGLNELNSKMDVMIVIVMVLFGKNMESIKRLSALASLLFGTLFLNSEA